MSLRRSARTPAKRVIEDIPEPAPTPTAKRQRAEPKPRPNTTSLPYLLTNPRSKLCKVNISDQISSGFFTEKSVQRIQTYNEAVADGTAHARWKDDEWDEDHPSESEEEPVAKSSTAKGKAKAAPSRKP
ncbi:hypothetical protein FRC00_010037, partial [Tulasnella sp. 408]